MKNLILLIAFLLALAFTASAQTAAPTPEDNAPRISLADAKKMYDDGTAVFVDARDTDSYNQEHIKGAILVSYSDWKKKLKPFAGKTVVVYCSCPKEHGAALLVTEMLKKGATNTFAMLGGTPAWKEAGYPIEGNQ